MVALTEIIDVPLAWRTRAHDLASFVASFLVNRRDRFGQYRSLNNRPKRVRKDGKIKVDTAFTATNLVDAAIVRHFQGADHGHVIGLHSTSGDNLCRWGVFDVDAHDESADPAKNLANALAILRELHRRGFVAMLEDSDGAGGYHIWILFSGPASSAKVYSLLKAVKRHLNIAVESFPKQPSIADCGNWFRIPGKHHTKNHYSRFYEEGVWLEAEDAIAHFVGTPLNDPASLPEPEPEEERTDPDGPFSRVANAAREWRNSGAEGWEGRYNDREISLQIMSKLPNNDAHFDDWLDVGMALKTVEDSAEMLAAWDAWSNLSGKHCQGECQRRWPTFTRAGGEIVTVKTLTWLAKNWGVKIQYFPDSQPRTDWSKWKGYNAATGVAFEEGAQVVMEAAPAEESKTPTVEDSPLTPEPSVATTARPRTEPKSDDPDPTPDPLVGTKPPISLDAPAIIPLSEEAVGYGWFADMVNAAAASTETPREMALCFGLGALATALMKKVVVRIESGYMEPAMLWLAPAMDPGTRKTAVASHMVRPIVTVEEEELAKLAPEIKRIENERKTMEARITHLRGVAARADKDNYGERAKEVAELEENLPVVPRPPRLFAQDVTMEHLGTMLADNNERMAIISDEGGFFELMAGRYSNGLPNLDLCLQAHTGSSPVRVDRGSRPPVTLRAPALTLAFCPQPSMLRSLSEIKGFRGRGLLARFFFMLPASTLGFRRLVPVPVPPEVAEDYDRRLRALLAMQPQEAGTPDERPYTIDLTKEAYRIFKRFQAKIERQMQPKAALSHVSDWASKLPGGVARIALVLHCALHAGAHPESQFLNETTMAQAVLLGEVFISHALAAFDLMGSDPAMETARRAWEWINDHQQERFTARECWHPLRGSIKTMKDMEAGFAVLVNTGHITSTDEQSPKRRGRPTSPSYLVNPHIVSHWGSQK